MEISRLEMSIPPNFFHTWEPFPLKTNIILPGETESGTMGNVTLNAPEGEIILLVRSSFTDIYGSRNRQCRSLKANAENMQPDQFFDGTNRQFYPLSARLTSA